MPIIFLGLLVLPLVASAVTNTASLSFSLPSVTHIGENFEVLVKADTGGVLINSVNIAFEYNKDLVSFAGYKDDNTVVRLWVDAPHEDKEALGVVSMSGIIPGGVSGLYDPTKQGISPVPIARLIFVANKEGTANFSFTKTQILKHDGKGTELPHEVKGGSIKVDGTIVNDSSKKIIDQTAPEPFSLTLVDSSLFSRTPDMIFFNAEDGDSGIKNYQIKIGLQDWKDTKSPQPIMKSLFSRNITVRALDFYGNFEDSSLVVPGILPLPVLIIIILLLIFSGILGFKLLKYKS